LFGKYINSEQLPLILDDFCRTSSITIDDYYQALKYAEGTRGNLFKHHPLKYKGEDGVNFFIELSDDIEKMRRESVSLGNKLCPSA
jgi:hypothetical protein